jgi:hypothetical protein
MTESAPIAESDFQLGEALISVALLALKSVVSEDLRRHRKGSEQDTRSVTGKSKQGTGKLAGNMQYETLHGGESMVRVSMSPNPTVLLDTNMSIWLRYLATGMYVP